MARLLLTIETTCDETAAAVIDENLQVISSVVSSQEALHQRYSGVVPELAARAHVERILPVIDAALVRANITLADLHAVAVAHTPGLAGSLLVGLSAAKAIAVGAGLPLVGINHLHGHIYACQIAFAKPIFPCVGLIVSGGHTSLYHCQSATEFQYLGGTIDDAAGEAFDKVAAMLALGYPGGPAVSKAAENGDCKAFDFPRAMRGSSLNFSFSGLKTAVRYALCPPGEVRDPKEFPATLVANIAASFEAAVVDSLVSKSLQALAQTGLSRICVGGGVAANKRLRRELAMAVEKRRGELLIAPPELCTDNAVMGGVAWELIRAGKFADLSLDVLPGLVRG